MNIQEVLAILQEVNKVLATLQAMGLKVSGDVSVPQILDLVTKKPAA